MTIEQANNEITKIINNPGLTAEAKKSQVRIYQTYIMNSNSEQTIFTVMSKYIDLVNSFTKETDSSYPCYPNVVANERVLKTRIEESPVGQELKKRNINYNNKDLKLIYIPDYETRHQTNLDDIRNAIKLYDCIIELLNIKENQMMTIAHNLGELVDYKIIYKKYNEKYVDRSGKVAVKAIIKSPEQLTSDYQKAVIFINELCYHDGILNSETKKIAMELLSYLFDYYKSEDFKFPSVLIEQLNNQESKLS